MEDSVYQAILDELIFIKEIIEIKESYIYSIFDERIFYYTLKAKEQKRNYET